MDNDLQDAIIIRPQDRFKSSGPIEPAIDKLVSQIVGKKIYTQDPRLIKLVVKWKSNKLPGSMQPDNFLSDPHCIEELKEVLSKDL
jgi:hypothetical protein